MTDTKKRIGGFSVVVEKVTMLTLTASQHILQFGLLQRVSPAALKPGVALCSGKPSSLSCSPLCCWSVKNVHSTWFRSPHSPSGPPSPEPKVSDGFATSVEWKKREKRRILLRKNRAGACRSRRLRLNEGCNHQLFKTLNHGVARCCCTNTHVRTHADKHAHTQPYHRLFKLGLWRQTHRDRYMDGWIEIKKRRTVASASFFTDTNYVTGSVTH